MDETRRRRYARQIALPGFGEAGQARLAQASALIVGLGGLGSPAALYLAAAGIGRLGLVEFDTVDASNLHRQILYGTGDEGRPKLEVAADRLRAVNPELQIDPVAEILDADNAARIVSGYDVVLDGTDNFAARYAVNDACVQARIPNVHGAVQRFEGQVMVLAHPEGPCYRCLFPDPPPPGSVPSCAEAGVIGVLPGTVGLLQATEALKLLTGIGEPLVGRLLRFDALEMRFSEVSIARDPECPVCAGSAREATRPSEHSGSSGSLPELPFAMGVDELARRRSEGDAPVVLDVRLPDEIERAALDGPVVYIPLHQLPSRLDELDPGTEYAVLCHHGVRSRHAVGFLRESGFARARDLAGGIDRWSREVDPSLPRY